MMEERDPAFDIAPFRVGFGAVLLAPNRRFMLIFVNRRSCASNKVCRVRKRRYVLVRVRELSLCRYLVMRGRGGGCGQPSQGVETKGLGVATKTSRLVTGPVEGGELYGRMST